MVSLDTLSCPRIIYIKLILWVSPWGLRWVSTVWFILLFGISNFFKTKIIERTMWILAGITFLVENILFIWFETIV